jgi:hypothetical protein
MHDGLKRSNSAWSGQYNSIVGMRRLTYVPLETRSMDIGGCAVDGLDAVD